MTIHVIDENTKQSVEVLDSDFIFEEGQEVIIIINGQAVPKIVKRVTFFLNTAGEQGSLKGSLSCKVFVV